MKASLYVHIPFCLAKCDYCDFFSIPRAHVPDEYISALLKEAEFYKAHYGITTWSTIYIGGGTPSLLSAHQITALLSFLLPENADEVTIEMNPETLTQEKLLACEENGVTRLSLGVQSLCEKSLCSVHRHCTAEIARESISLVKKTWHGKLNLDAIAGLPNQDDETFIFSLKEIISYNSDHISLYTLTVEEGTPLFLRIESGEDFDSDNADRQWLLGRTLLEENSFFQYEVSNFAKEGSESRHNMCYWQQENYVGIGSGATGTMYDFSGDESTLRWSNTQDIKKYIRFWNSDSALREKMLPREEEKLSLSTLEFEFLMMGLRTTKGVSQSEYSKRFKTLSPWNGSLEKRLCATNPHSLWSKFMSEKKAHVYANENRYALSKEGLLFLNPLLRELI